MIYLDNNATTRTAPEVADAMDPWIRDQYGNASAGYRFGKAARKAIEEAREKVAALIEASPEEIVFTSGGTEAINTIIVSATRIWPEKRTLVASGVEHSAVFEALGFLEKEAGCTRQLVSVDSGGNLDLEHWENLTGGEGVAIASLIWANNETGVISPVEEAARIARESGVFFHTDAVQAVGKIPVSVKGQPVHALSMSAHKFHGPKGIGALYVNRHTRFAPLLHGGGQEKGRRSGTENVAGIVGMGVAAELAAKRLDQSASVARLRDDFEAGVRAAVEAVEINGSTDNRLPNTTNLFFPGVDGEGLLILLDEAGLCCSPGSACSTGSVQPSRILIAMGQPSKRARSSVRFSLSHLTTEEEIGEAVEKIAVAVGKLRINLPSGGGVKINT